MRSDPVWPVWLPEKLFFYSVEPRVYGVFFLLRSDLVYDSDWRCVSYLGQTGRNGSVQNDQPNQPTGRPRIALFFYYYGRSTGRMVCSV